MHTIRLEIAQTVLINGYSILLFVVAHKHSIQNHWVMRIVILYSTCELQLCKNSGVYVSATWEKRCTFGGA